MWTTVYISQKPEEAENIRKHLEESGVAVKFRCVSKTEEGEEYFEILVPSREISVAHNLIIDLEL